MLYICLCGFPPFSEESAPPSMKMQIKQGLFSFPSPYWDDISQEAKDLIKALLKVNPNERLTAVEAYDHPWMQMNVSKNAHVVLVLDDINRQCFCRMMLYINVFIVSTTTLHRH
jgi:serine/threonine protein kinase